MSIIKVEDIAHVRFTAPDLGEMRNFLDEFGLRHVTDDGALYMRGCGTAPFVHATTEGEPDFVGLGFRAASKADLKAIAEAEGTSIETLDAPGGGSVVRLTDPDGRAVEIVAGQEEVAPIPVEERPPFNSIEGGTRRRSEAVRLKTGPSHVVRLGHCMLNAGDLAATIAWYQEKLGFLVSDEVELEPGLPIGYFMRCDRGDTPTDHHTLAIVQGADGPGFNHAAFEVASLDDLMLGHTHLKKAERQQEWGVGRHILGSQIFDYWRDPWGHTLEHWTDGDLFTASDPAGKAGIDQMAGVQWGPDLPPTMV